MDEFLTENGLAWFTATDDKTIKETYWRIWRQTDSMEVAREKVEIILNNEGKIKVSNKELFARIFECESDILKLPLEIIEALELGVDLQRGPNTVSRDEVKIFFNQNKIIDYVSLFANEEELERFCPEFRLQRCFDEEEAYARAKVEMYNYTIELGKKMNNEKKDWGPMFIEGLFRDLKLIKENGGK